jgi:hypothetical protein
VGRAFGLAEEEGLEACAWTVFCSRRGGSGIGSVYLLQFRIEADSEAARCPTHSMHVEKSITERDFRSSQRSDEQ